MSRSRRKTPITGICVCASEKEDKRLWHRKMRAMIRQRLLNPDLEAILIPLDNEAGNVWCMGKDGKWPFDPQEFPRLMRK